MIAIHAAEPATAVDRAIAWKCGNLGKRVYAQPTPMCIKRSKATWIAGLVRRVPTHNGLPLCSGAGAYNQRSGGPEDRNRSRCTGNVRASCTARHFVRPTVIDDVHRREGWRPVAAVSVFDEAATFRRSGDKVTMVPLPTLSR